MNSSMMKKFKTFNILRNATIATSLYKNTVWDFDGPAFTVDIDTDTDNSVSKLNGRINAVGEFRIINNNST